MREIKFRGLTDTESPTWVYGCLVNNLWTYSEHSKYKNGDAVCEIITGKYDGDCWQDIAEDEGDTIVTVIPESVGQYTGLKDKNGKEIYEGDILKTLRFRNVVTNHVETILFLDGSFCTQTNDDVTVPMSYHKEKEIEIIGNVWENPELLTPKP